MEKALLSSEDIHECPTDDGSLGAPTARHALRTGVTQKHAFRHGGVPRPLGTCTPLEASSHVLVTFRGIAVDETLVRNAQQRAAELGLASAGELHVLLSKHDGHDAHEVCKAIVRARVGAQCYERCAHAVDALPAMQAAFDALSTDCPIAGLMR